MLGWIPPPGGTLGIKESPDLDASSQPLPPTVRYERQERHKEEVVGEKESRGEGVAGLMVGHEVLRSRPPRRVKDCTPGAGRAHTPMGVGMIRTESL